MAWEMGRGMLWPVLVSSLMHSQLGSIRFPHTVHTNSTFGHFIPFSVIAVHHTKFSNITAHNMLKLVHAAIHSELRRSVRLRHDPVSRSDLWHDQFVPSLASYRNIRRYWSDDCFFHSSAAKTIGEALLCSFQNARS
jgi:hypothetical protein